MSYFKFIYYCKSGSMLYLKPQKQKLAKVVVVYEHLSLLALNHL
jgi:hypothetical protein